MKQTGGRRKDRETERRGSEKMKQTGRQRNRKSETDQETDRKGSKRVKQGDSGMTEEQRRGSERVETDR